MQGQVLDDDFLLGQRGWIELEPDLVGFDEVVGEHEGIGDLEGAQLDRGLAGQQIELPHIHLGAEELAARFLGRLPGHRLGEDPYQHAKQDKEQEQRADRFPAEDLDRHGRNIL